MNGEKLVYENMKGGFFSPNKKPYKVGYEHVVVNVMTNSLMCKACGKTIIMDSEEKKFDSIIQAFMKNHKDCKSRYCAMCKAGLPEEEQ